MAQVLAVISGKGGTGKTSLCAGIASCLAMDGLRVLCHALFPPHVHTYFVL